MKQIFDSLKKQSPSRIIALAFSAVILVGAVLLMMPFSLKKGVHLSFLNALFTSTSAVCVTGLVVVDTADSFTAIGQAIVAALIQIGGLGIASVGVGLIIAAGKRVSIKSRLMVKEALNVDTYHGMVRLVRIVLAITLGFEAAGAIISFFVFRKDYSPLHAVGISIFHSIAAFNNAGFDNLGGMHNLIPYKDNILLNITTDVLVIVGGIGFLVLVDIVKQKSFKKLCLHSKVAISMTAVLLIGGTLILKATENIPFSMIPSSKSPIVLPKKNETVVTVVDSRINSSNWKLYLNYINPMIERDGKVLIDSLFFKKFNNEEIALKTNKKLIYESNDNGGNVNVSTVTFSTDKGLFLKPSESLLEDEDYSTMIIWSIEE